MASGNGGPTAVGIGSRTSRVPGSRCGDAFSSACSRTMGWSWGSADGRGASGRVGACGTDTRREYGDGVEDSASEGSMNHGTEEGPGELVEGWRDEAVDSARQAASGCPREAQRRLRTAVPRESLRSTESIVVAAELECDDDAYEMSGAWRGAGRLPRAPMAQIELTARSLESQALPRRCPSPPPPPPPPPTLRQQPATMAGLRMSVVVSATAFLLGTSPHAPAPPPQDADLFLNSIGPAFPPTAHLVLAHACNE